MNARMAVMAGLMRMTKFQQRTMCDFVGATHFNEFMTKNELSLAIVDHITVQPPATTRTHEHKHTNTNTPPALRAEVAAARVAPGLLFLFVFEKIKNIFWEKLKIFLKELKICF